MQPLPQYQRSWREPVTPSRNISVAGGSLLPPPFASVAECEAGSFPQGFGLSFLVLTGVEIRVTELGVPGDIAIPGETWEYRGFTFLPILGEITWKWQAEVGPARLVIKRFQGPIGGFTSELLVRNKAGTIVPRFNSLVTGPRYHKVQLAVDALISHMSHVAEEASYFRAALEGVTGVEPLPSSSWYDRISC